MKTIVYLDILFLINFIINLIILKLTCIFMKHPSSLSRMSVGAVVGGIYAICVFFPHTEFLYIIPFKVIVSMIMIAITFRECSVAKFVKSCAIFYLTSFSFAGIMLALSCFTNFTNSFTPFRDKGIYYFNISISTLIVSALIVYILLWLTSSVFTKSKMTGIRKLKIALGRRECVLRALCDTGNLLTDPISNLPVVIADKKSVLSLFPGGIPDIKNGCTSGAKVRVIPYSSLGTKNEIMTGFVPDKVEIDGKTEMNVIIGISENSLSETDEYNALFNPNILN